MTKTKPIILYGFGEHFGLPESSPYVMKTEVHLKLLAIPYTKQHAMPPQSPKGQLPFIDDQGVVVADSTFIRNYLETRRNRSLDAGLSAAQRAQAWAVERMIENHFAWAVGHARCLIPENFEKGDAHWFDEAPAEMRDQLKAQMLDSMRGTMETAGLSRHSNEEIVELGDRSLAAMSCLLDDRKYLFGDDPTGTDASMFAMLAATLTPFFDSPLRRRAESYENLRNYVRRAMSLFYPDFTWAGL